MASSPGRRSLGVRRASSIARLELELEEDSEDDWSWSLQQALKAFKSKVRFRAKGRDLRLPPGRRKTEEESSSSSREFSLDDSLKRLMSELTWTADKVEFQSEHSFSSKESQTCIYALTSVSVSSVDLMEIGEEGVRSALVEIAAIVCRLIHLTVPLLSRGIIPQCFEALAFAAVDLSNCDSLRDAMRQGGLVGVLGCGLNRLSNISAKAASAFHDDDEATYGDHEKRRGFLPLRVGEWSPETLSALVPLLCTLCNLTFEHSRSKEELSLYLAHVLTCKAIVSNSRDPEVLLYGSRLVSSLCESQRVRFWVARSQFVSKLPQLLIQNVVAPRILSTLLRLAARLCTLHSFQRRFLKNNGAKVISAILGRLFRLSSEGKALGFLRAPLTAAPHTRVGGDSERLGLASQNSLFKTQPASAKSFIVSLANHMNERFGSAREHHPSAESTESERDSDDNFELFPSVLSGSDGSIPPGMVSTLKGCLRVTIGILQTGETEGDAVQMIKDADLLGHIIAIAMRLGRADIAIAELCVKASLSASLNSALTECFGNEGGCEAIVFVLEGLMDHIHDTRRKIGGVQATGDGGQYENRRVDYDVNFFRTTFLCGLEALAALASHGENRRRLAEFRAIELVLSAIAGSVDVLEVEALYFASSTTASGLRSPFPVKEGLVSRMGRPMNRGLPHAKLLLALKALCFDRRAVPRDVSAQVTLHLAMLLTSIVDLVRKPRTARQSSKEEGLSFVALLDTLHTLSFHNDRNVRILWEKGVFFSLLQLFVLDSPSWIKMREPLETNKEGDIDISADDARETFDGLMKPRNEHRQYQLLRKREIFALGILANICTDAACAKFLRDYFSETDGNPTRHERLIRYCRQWIECRSACLEGRAAAATLLRNLCMDSEVLTHVIQDIGGAKHTLEPLIEVADDALSRIVPLDTSTDAIGNKGNEFQSLTPIDPLVSLFDSTLLFTLHAAVDGPPMEVEDSVLRRVLETCVKITTILVQKGHDSAQWSGDSSIGRTIEDTIVFVTAFLPGTMEAEDEDTKEWCLTCCDLLRNLFALVLQYVEVWKLTGELRRRAVCLISLINVSESLLEGPIAGGDKIVRKYVEQAVDNSAKELLVQAFPELAQSRAVSQMHGGWTGILKVCRQIINEEHVISDSEHGQ